MGTMRLIPLLFSIVLASCSSQQGRLHTGSSTKVYFKQADKSFLTDTRASLFSRHGAVTPSNIICPEPSPDVAKAIASSFSGSLNIFGRGSAAITAEQAESIAQLVERTAAIQLLRDKMYETCIAYSNGAISGTTYSLLMARLDETIVTLALGEASAGAFGRSLAALSAESKGAASGAVVSALGEIDDLNEIAAEVAKIDQNIAELENELSATKELEIPAAGGDRTEDDVQQDQKEKDAKISEVETKLASAQLQRSAAIDLLQARSQSTGEGKASTQATAGGGTSPASSIAISESLEDLQSEYLLQDFSRNIIAACMVELSQAERPLSAAQAFRLTLARDKSALELRRANLQMQMSKIEEEAAPSGENDEYTRLVREEQSIQSQIGLIEEQLNIVDQLGVTDRNPNATRVFDELLADWKSNNTRWNYNERGKRLEILVGAMNADRRSMLADFCDTNLSSLLIERHKSDRNYRTEKARLEASADIARAKIGFVQAPALALREAKELLAECGKLPESNDAEKALKVKCRTHAVRALEGAPHLTDVVEPLAGE